MDWNAFWHDKGVNREHCFESLKTGSKILGGGEIEVKIMLSESNSSLPTAHQTYKMYPKENGV